ncbi:prepilin peptidase [Thalassococcus halodurans]|nr:prepilin peptidase [Thalassococcus halodurans]
MLNSLSALVIISVVAVLVWVVRIDYRSLRIPNKMVLLLLAQYFVWASLTGFATIIGDLVAGTVLFLIALISWLFRMMGAGDVKLYVALGMFIGFDHLSLYVVLLFLISVVFVVLIRLSKFVNLGPRMNEIRTSGKAPYAVPMCFAAIPAILVRTFA